MKTMIAKHRINQLGAAIDNAQLSARVRTVSTDDLFSAVEHVEKKLTGLLYKKDWRGLRFIVDINAQKFPNSYHGNPESTQFEIERGANNWFLIRVYRGICSSQANEIQPLNIDSKADQLVDFATKAKHWGF